ncbi:hypothetical protein RJ639_025451 [Escallonia herrerae]|uniref:Uncharacterized protein n=1 Tax=Escallonia herrerae TaxID=1293975 RepID=A0AA88UX64_9ASTE|nr:hypothetical protein RJ639_025451 [Escallonia herrerae]
MNTERRPYHRNCSCVLHKSKGALTTACLQHGNVSFPRIQKWDACSLSKTASRIPSESSHLGDLSDKNTEKTKEVGRNKEALYMWTKIHLQEKH